MRDLLLSLRRRHFNTLPLFFLIVAYVIISTTASTPGAGWSQGNSNTQNNLRNEGDTIPEEKKNEEPRWSSAGWEFDLFGSGKEKIKGKSKSRRSDPVLPIRNPLLALRDWVTTGNPAPIQCRLKPKTTLKVSKTFRPLKTIIRLGADFNTQLGVWQFKSSWADSIVGGELTLKGRELQFSKSWLLSTGVVEDLMVRGNLRAAVDLGTMKAYARLGFRTEQLSPFNIVEGLTLREKFPLDGNNGHVKLEIKANVAFPQPEIKYSTENRGSFVGMGPIEVNVDEMNLLLDY